LKTDFTGGRYGGHLLTFPHFPESILSH